MNITYQLSKLLGKLGITSYLAKVEFTAHLFASTTALLLSIVLNCHYISIGWIIFSLIDEFHFDGWLKKIKEHNPETSYIDLYHDLISKVGLPLIYIAIVAYRAFL